MVRAAVSGAVDYSRADPLDNRWRIKHRLIISEIQRRESQHMLEYLHQHWCAYVSHGGLEETSFSNVKKNAAEILKDLQAAVFPWNAEVKKEDESEAKNSKIDDEPQLDDQTKALIKRYREKFQRPEKGKK
jgi:hypothetical protein